MQSGALPHASEHTTCGRSNVAWFTTPHRDRREGAQMADIERITVEEAHRKVDAHQALLVCAYEDDAKCRMINLEGSISLTSFESRAGSLPKTQEIIFYCA
jgi:hypothetical protein